MARQVLAARAMEGKEVQEAGMRGNTVKNVFPLVSFPGSTFCLINDGATKATGKKNATHGNKAP